VSWFPLLFGIFFIVSFLVDEVRRRGHLRLGRDPKKGEIIGVLVILGFNFVVAAPIIIVGLLIEYTVGAPPALELLLIAVMSLAELIPIFLSGIFSYFIVKGIYDKWGVSIGVFFVTSILTLLVLIDSVGWLQPGAPYIIEMVSSLVVFQVEFLLIWILFAVCLGKCMSSSREPEDVTQKQEQKVRGLSIESSLILLVGLGKRIVNDADDEAHESLKSIYESHPQCAKTLTVASKEIEIDMASIIAKNDMVYSQQSMEFANKQFGKLTKRYRNIIVLFLIIAFVSAVVAVALIFAEIYLGIFLFMPTIILPLIGYFGYQQSARFEEGRYASPAVTQFNSFLLTREEFRKRVVRERIVFGFSLLVLCGIICVSLMGVLASSVVWGVIGAAIIIIVSILSTRDRFLNSERLELPVIVERGLKFIGVEDVEELAEDDLLEQPYEQQPTASPAPDVSLDWKQQLEIRGHGDFVKKIVDKSTEAYDEQGSTMIYLGVGAIMTFMGVLTYFMFGAFSFMGWLKYIGVAFSIVGIPLLLFGLYRYLKTRNSTRFHKLNRKNLTLLLSYFDQKVQGVTNFGALTDTHAPSEYLNFGIVQMFMHTFIRVSVARLQYRVPWPQELVERAWKTRSSYPKYESVGILASSLIFVIVYQWFSSFSSSYFPDILKLVFLGLIGFIALTMVWAFIVYYMEKRALSDVIGLMQGIEDVSYRETLTALINLFIAEFPMPLRVLFVGNYSNIAYTGRVLYTSTGIELREAVIIPQGMITDVS